MRKPRSKYRPGQMIVIFGQYVFAGEPSRNENILEVYDASLYTATAAEEATVRQIAKRQRLTMPEVRQYYTNLQCKIVQPHT